MQIQKLDSSSDTSITSSQSNQLIKSQGTCSIKNEQMKNAIIDLANNALSILGPTNPNVVDNNHAYLENINNNNFGHVNNPGPVGIYNYYAHGYYPNPCGSGLVEYVCYSIGSGPLHGSAYLYGDNNDSGYVYSY